jgi:hypothetical protein
MDEAKEERKEMSKPLPRKRLVPTRPPYAVAQILTASLRYPGVPLLRRGSCIVR